MNSSIISHPGGYIDHRTMCRHQHNISVARMSLWLKIVEREILRITAAAQGGHLTLLQKKDNSPLFSDQLESTFKVEYNLELH